MQLTASSNGTVDGRTVSILLYTMAALSMPSATVTWCLWQHLNLPYCKNLYFMLEKRTKERDYTAPVKKVFSLWENWSGLLRFENLNHNVSLVCFISVLFAVFLEMLFAVFAVFWSKTPNLRRSVHGPSLSFTSRRKHASYTPTTALLATCKPSVSHCATSSESVPAQHTILNGGNETSQWACKKGTVRGRL
jgi:phage shock protein PspC (stress-responsive transcriptional regulator)